MQRVPMTPAGKVRMQRELDRLKTVERPAIVAAIEEARAHGDLKENAEYHYAKDKQGMIEGKIREYETKLALADVIDPLRLSGKRVSFGATLRVMDLDQDEESVYRIVGEDEADFKNGLLNYLSPLARGFLGKEEGDEIEIETAGGTRAFEILEVRYVEIVLPELGTSR